MCNEACHVDPDLGNAAADPARRDAPAYEKHFVEWEIISQLSTVPWPYPPGGVPDFIRKVILPQQGKDTWFWGIFRKPQPTEMIGIVHLWRHGRPENRGFWLGRRFWGQG